MDRNAVVQGVTDTLYDYCTFADEARLDDFVALFCEDGCFAQSLAARRPTNSGHQSGSSARIFARRIWVRTATTSMTRQASALSSPMSSRSTG
jgi:hypothetical protein